AGASGDLEASVHNAEVVETLGMSDALLARWRELNARVLGLQSGAFRKSAAMASMTRSLRQAVQVAILAVGAWLVITQAATPGIMVATTILLGRALAPVEQIVGSWRLLAEGRAAWRRLRGLADADVDLAPRMTLPAPAGRLEANGVALRAPGADQLILAGVGLALAPGEVLAVVGPSGAGKSSLVRVLAGVWPPSAGAVRLDGVELGQWTREALGPHIGYVPQDVELFRATVAENIARLGPVESGAVLAAAQAAGVHEMILELPDGYDTQVEPAGGVLSPGQRQRIALARALYGSPKLLLLDEPNSNLDGAGEQALGQAISALRGKVTTVMVTHRSTLVQHADKMLVLESGQVRHFGKVGEVMQALAQNAARSGAQVVQMPRAGEGA
ncbi:MAG: type I secretion system permease/ATPase, partial [Gammaproteobacteria bacterium]